MMMMTDSFITDDSELDKLEKDLERLVAEFRLAAQAQQLVVIPDECDEFIRRCLRVKDYNAEKALELSKQFGIASMEIRKWETPFSPSLLHHQGIFNKLVFMLAKRDLGGRRILLINFGDWDPKENPYHDFLTAIVLILQFATYGYLESQRNGVVVIVNCNSFSAHQFWNFGLKRSISFMTWMQKGVVCRIKALHVIYHPKVISVIHGAIKPFLSAKMQQRIIFHGDNASSLHKYMEPSALPPNLRDGGNSNNRNVVTYDVDDFRDKELHQRLLREDQFFQTWIEKGFPIR